MSLDETLFAVAWRFVRAVWRHPTRDVASATSARLTDLRSHLILVARALSGEALDIQAAESSGGFAGTMLYLPQTLSIATTPADNALAYVYRVAYTVQSRQLGCLWRLDASPQALSQVFGTLLAVPRTLQALEAALPMTSRLRQQFFPLLLQARPPCECLETASERLEALTQLLLGRAWATLPAGPGLAWLQRCLNIAAQGESAADQQALWHELRQCPGPGRPRPVQPVSLWGQLMVAPPGSVLPDEPVAQLHDALPGGTERAARPREHVRRVSLDARDIANDVLIHTFEKVETAEEFQGVTRTPDGADELEQHAEALDELDLRHVVRSAVRTESIYKAEMLLDTDSGDLSTAEPPAPATFVYDEWDGKARQYKPRWCHVTVSRPPPPSAHDAAHASDTLRQYARVTHEVRLLLDKIRQRRKLKNRQSDGADIDLDALIERYATVRSGQQPDDRLYLLRRRHSRDLVTLILVDMSYSTDAWIQGHRVLDIAKTAVLVLGEVLAQWRDRVGIAGFYSHTRRDCHVVSVKSFDTPWPRSRATLASLKPTGYTRIGPALRHSIHLLQQEHAARKLLLLISDGKPTDYDRYEGRYGIADVRQAIREAGQAHIHAYALAVDVQAKLYLPQMFGHGNFQILPHPTHLVAGLAQLYSRLSR